MSTSKDAPAAPEAATPAAEQATPNKTSVEQPLFPVPLDDDGRAAPVIGPRTRWAAIVWGLVFAALASGALYVVLSPEHRLELIEWVTSLEPATLALYGALAIGVIVLLFGLVGLLRRAQRAIAARRSSAR